MVCQSLHEKHTVVLCFVVILVHHIVNYCAIVHKLKVTSFRACSNFKVRAIVGATIGLHNT